MNDSLTTSRPGRSASAPVAATITAALLAGLATGCPHNKYQALEASDVPIAVTPVTQTVPDVEMTYIRDALGNPVASEARIVGHHQVVTDYTLVRGDRPIDEQDYYHLAGDQEAFGKVRDARASGARTMRIGLAIMAASAVGTVLSPILIDGLGGQAASGASLVFGFPIGLFVWYRGKKPFREHVMSASRAFGAINQEPAPWVRDLPR